MAVKIIKALQCRCERCGHEWQSRGQEMPTICPACKSPYWNRPRQKVSADLPADLARFVNLTNWERTNRAPFHGVLVLLDAVSDASPMGAYGHLVLMPSRVAQRSVDSLLGMGLSCDPALARHNPRQKIGVIDHAEVVEKRIEFGGHIFASDFPEIISVLADPKSDLGVSYEARNCTIKNKGADIWRITDCVFTGAAILNRQSAAYRSTRIRLDFQA